MNQTKVLTETPKVHTAHTVDCQKPNYIRYSRCGLSKDILYLCKIKKTRVDLGAAVSASLSCAYKPIKCEIKGTVSRNSDVTGTMLKELVKVFKLIAISFPVSAQQSAMGCFQKCII